MSQDIVPEPHPGPRAILADRVFDGHRFHQATAVLIEGARIRALAPWADVPPAWPQRRLPPDMLLAPGFIDLQVNGGGGILLNDAPTAENMRAIARAHHAFGTTACLPTFISDTREKIREVIAAARLASGHDGVLGLHLEGPFLNPARKGIHRADMITAPGPDDLDMLLELREVGRSLVTLAPECVPAGFLRALASSNVVVSAGHSEASAGEIARAADDGLRGVTHLFNAMAPFSARAPGLIGATLADHRLVAGIIVDGLHVDPVAVRAAFAAKGPAGMALVSDAMPTVGAGVTQFDLMGRTVRLRDGRLTAEDQTLAGAHLDMASAVRNAVNLVGLPLGVALQSAARTPAELLGVAHELGCLAAGAYADMVALTPALKVVATWIQGREAGLLPKL